MQDDKAQALDELLLMPDGEFAQLMIDRYTEAGSPRDRLAEQRLKRRLAVALPAVAGQRH